MCQQTVSGDEYTVKLADLAHQEAGEKSFSLVNNSESFDHRESEIGWKLHSPPGSAKMIDFSIVYPIKIDANEKLADVDFDAPGVCLTTFRMECADQTASVTVQESIDQQFRTGFLEAIIHGQAAAARRDSRRGMVLILECIRTVTDAIARVKMALDALMIKIVVATYANAELAPLFGLTEHTSGEIYHLFASMSHLIDLKRRLLLEGGHGKVVVLDK